MFSLCSPAKRFPFTKQQGQPNIFFCSTRGPFGASSLNRLINSSDDFSQVIFVRVATTPPRLNYDHIEAPRFRSPVAARIRDHVRYLVQETLMQIVRPSIASHYILSLFGVT